MAPWFVNAIYIIYNLMELGLKLGYYSADVVLSPWWLSIVVISVMLPSLLSQLGTSFLVIPASLVVMPLPHWVAHLIAAAGHLELLASKTASLLWEWSWLFSPTLLVVLSLHQYFLCTLLHFWVVHLPPRFFATTTPRKENEDPAELHIPFPSPN